ncbi:MAG: PD-(D/E)XK nuclease family protein [Ignavibacteria bacterium]
MKPFLEKLAEEVIQNYGSTLPEVCIVFPSRRAGIYFKKFLSQKITKPVFSPEVFGISDFIEKLSPFQIADKLTLVFELYQIYKGYSDEEFERFYPWGEMMVSDFDEIDKNLTDADRLFKVIKEHKEVEEQFELGFSEIENFERFWETFSKLKPSKMKADFLKTWELLGKVYKSFRQSLSGKNICYEGMAYRRIYEMLRTGESKFEWRRVIFAGFNLLNKAEEGIIRELIKKGIAETYWDADKYYFSDPLQEGGIFLRENFSKLEVKEPRWVEGNLAASEKNIRIIAAPLAAGQAKALGYELGQLDKASHDNTAVVLPDESMLIPVLHSIPENIDSINVTMGYPVKYSSLYSLIRFLKNLHKNKKEKSGEIVFYHNDVEQILMHSYIKFQNIAENFGAVNDIKKKNIIYISRERILSYYTDPPDIIKTIFKAVESSEETFEYLYSIILLISQQFDRSRETGFKFEREFIYSLYSKLNYFKEVISSYGAGLNREICFKLLLEDLHTAKIPLTGEPLKGIQIMGLLETRALDFENVIILSMNEGIMPRGNLYGSFIPYNLRKAFKLPNYEDEDSIYAYNFYRLIQRAKNITLIYKTQEEGVAPGEVSRFIMQIENELREANPLAEMKRLTFQPEVILKGIKKIAVHKTDEVIQSLKALPQISASGLSSYINCTLQFYFSTIARLKEEEAIEEALSPMGFGIILHKIMEFLYNDYKGKTIGKTEIEKIQAKFNSFYDEIWKQACESIEELREFGSEVYGRNLLYKGVIKKLIGKILENDKLEAPIKILDLEKKATREIEIQVNGGSVKIKLLGILDRIEEKDSKIRIIDYKTGAVKTKSKDFEKIFSGPDFRDSFQQYFYAYTYKEDNPQADIKMGIYYLRNMEDGISFLDEEAVTSEELSNFEEGLKKKLSELFDTEIPFVQTEHIDRCKWCPYNSICYREKKPT